MASTTSEISADLMDERGYYPQCVLEGLASTLASLVSQLVDSHGGPVPIERIRQVVREEICPRQSYSEYHYHEYSQWFVRMSFLDGSYITWGLSEDI